MRALLAAALVAGLAACGGPKQVEEEAPKSAMAQQGSRWAVSKGERPVFSMTNRPGPVKWKAKTEEHAFLSAELLDMREESKLRDILRRSRHFRDFVQRLVSAGYRVSPADS